MANRERIPDQRTMGESELIPYQAGEDPRDRHARRLETNLRFQEEVKRFCQQRNVTFEVKNRGHHWIFRRGGRTVEWWPSSAKLVIDKKWHKGVHVHDYRQAIQIVHRHFPTHEQTTMPERMRENDYVSDYQI